MPKKGKKGKKVEQVEPPHDASWERSVESGNWERPPDALPDANTWPTWGALRERILTSCKKISIMYSPGLRDGFPAEIFKLSPPDLQTIHFRGCDNLTKFVLSPITSCPSLEDIELVENNAMSYVLLQSNTLASLSIHNCPSLEKALIHCKNLSSLTITKCPKLRHIMLLTDELSTLDLSDSTSLMKVDLQCPNLTDKTIPPLVPPPKPANPSHPPMSAMLRQKYGEVQAEKTQREEEEQAYAVMESIIPRTHRPFSL
mmetsp:Transcript_14006/g.35948  ORF Transcript_14006/g.35948 Transcript_14006/m.35948 type:complete len:258 (-) Transcript_14006:10-783(-)|eukprot:jgi/Tetstr1/447770/TSEL_035101.t1